MRFLKYDLTGKTALITGGGGLLGIQHAAALLEAGAHVVLTDINDKALTLAAAELKEEFKDSQVSLKLMDVAKLESVNSTAKELKESGFRVDILVNNAAIDPKVSKCESRLESSRLENFSIDQWDQEVAVGLTGSFICSRVFGTIMASDGKGGVILNIASDLSVIAPDQRLYRKSGLEEDMQPVKPVTYSVIKAGLVGLTRYLATYWPHKGVRANALSPGGVFTGQPDEFVSHLVNLIPLGRMASKNEYRGIVQFLCSDASAYLNGQNIVMDGGRSVL